MNEKLSADDGIKAYIDDFKKSDAPQFQGKSASKRKEMAIAAYLDAKKGPKKESAPCWDGYKQVGMKKKGDRMVPNCMPENYRAARAQSNAANKMYGRTSDSAPKKPISHADLFRAIDKKYGSPKKKTGIYAKEGTASRWKAQDAAANIYSKEKRKPDNREIDKIRAKYADKKKSTQEGAVKATNKAKKNRIDREAGQQYRKDNPVPDPEKQHKGYGAHATAIGRALRSENTLSELTAREKEMIAKRKASRTKKKMPPSKKAGKDAARDGAGRQGMKSTKPTVGNRLAGSGKSRGTEHIIMQLRKAQDVDGKMDIQVSPKGKKVRLAKKDIDALLRRHDSMQKPRDKRLFRVMLTRKLRQK